MILAEGRLLPMATFHDISAIKPPLPVLSNRSDVSAGAARISLPQSRQRLQPVEKLNSAATGLFRRASASQNLDESLDLPAILFP